MRDCLRFWIRLFTMLMATMASLCYAYTQYYPSPPPIGPDMSSHLHQQLKDGPRDISRVGLLLDLTNLYFNKPLKRKKDLDSAMFFAKEAIALSSYLKDSADDYNAQLFVADIFTARGAMPAAENILPLLNDTARIDLLLNLSFKYFVNTYLPNKFRWDKSERFGQMAKELSAKYNLPEKEILAREDIAMAQADRGDTGAEKDLLDVVARYKAIGYRRLHYVYNNLAWLEWNNGHPDKAEYFSLSALKSMNETGDSLDAGDIYAVRGEIYYNEDDYEQALQCDKMAMAKYELHSGWRSNLAIFSYGYSLERLKRYPEALAFFLQWIKDHPPQDDDTKSKFELSIGRVYRNMRMYDKASLYLRSAVSLSERAGLSSSEQYRQLGQLYLETGHPSQAKVWLKKAVVNATVDLSVGSQRHLHYMLFLADSATGDYLSALKENAVLKNLEDLSFRESKEKELQKVKAEFETEKKDAQLKQKDQSIQLLNQSGQLQVAALERERLIRNVTIGFVVLLISLSAALYKQFRDKKKGNEIITAQNQLITTKNGQLERLVGEKESLLKEVHHRVKNNLYMVMCLLESQAAQLDKEALRAVESSQHRIYAMSLIHQKLYQSDNISSVDMAVYLPELVYYLAQSFDSSQSVHFSLAIAPLKLEVSRAIPLALIINEAVTNSIKYAFPEGRKGEIYISLEVLAGEVRLEVADNGIGLSPKTDASGSDSLGIDLMKGLSTDIGGKISFANKSGTNIVVTFKVDPAKRSLAVGSVVLPAR
jgi:two-component system, sensor histidine kinase PdtaS